MKADAVLCVFGWLLAGMSVSMFIPAFAAMFADDAVNMQVFFNSGAVTGFFAGAIIISLHGKEVELTKRGGLLLIVLPGRSCLSSRRCRSISQKPFSPRQKRCLRLFQVLQPAAQPFLHIWIISLRPF